MRAFCVQDAFTLLGRENGRVREQEEEEARQVEPTEGSVEGRDCSVVERVVSGAGVGASEAASAMLERGCADRYSRPLLCTSVYGIA